MLVLVIILDIAVSITSLHEQPIDFHNPRALDEQHSLPLLLLPDAMSNTKQKQRVPGE